MGSKNNHIMPEYNYQFKIGIYLAPEEPACGIGRRYPSSIIIDLKLIPKMALKMNLAEISVE